MKKILLVDDDALAREGLSFLLRTEGYEVYLAENGIVAMELYRSITPDLILTDILMPEKDGLEIIMEVRRINPSARIIALSGGGRLDALSHLNIAKELGAYAIITKPYNNDEVKLIVQKAILGL